ncbi:MAG: hypothetical protein LBE83_10620, partial [Propionibacteriaceae bacterium]|nr:hypothetical protein [Propionibacteriaceae bacterium]
KPVAQDIAYIEDTCLGIDGATIYNFKTRFLRRLDDYVTEYYNLSLLLGSGLSGEAKMWANTEKALGAFQSDLDGVINSIRQEEQLLSDSLATSNQIDLTSLNLDNQLHGEDEDGNTLNFGTAAAFAGIDWNSTVLNDIMTHALPNIENYLTQASQSLKQSNSQSVWLRDYRLGIDASGCWSQWNIINSKLGELVRDLAWECETAVELLRRASAAITDETIASAQALADFADQISGGYVEPRPRTGWGNFRVDSQGY